MPHLLAPQFRYDLSKGLRPRRSVRTAMQHEIMMYCIVQKEGLGLDKAVEVAKDRMSRYSVTPNMLVVPPQVRYSLPRILPTPRKHRALPC